MRVYIIIILLALSFSAICQEKYALATKVETFNFGAVEKGKPVKHIFEVLNSGSEPVIIDNVTTTCGCTKPVWSKEAIMPGEVAEIEVGFNAAEVGSFKRPITLFYNNQTKKLYITGVVKPND